MKEKVRGATRVRADTLGYMQRCFPTIRSEVDAEEARAAAAFVVRSLLEGDGKSGSVAIRRKSTDGPYEYEFFFTDLKNVAKHTRSLPPEYIADSGKDVTQAFIDYALPLVGELPGLGRLGASKVEPRL